MIRPVFYPSDLLKWLLLPFIVGLMTLSRIEGYSKLMVLFGLIYSCLFLIYSLYRKLSLQPEVIIYFAWTAWSIIGTYNAIDLAMHFQALMTALQIGVFIFLVAGIIALYRNISIVMIAIIIGGIIVALSSYLYGEFQLATQIEARTRATGLAGNANSFAYYLLFAVFAVFFFWEIKSSLWWRVILSALLAIYVSGIIYSGSRKGFLTLVVFTILWFLFCLGKRLFKKPITVFVTLLILSVGIYFITDFVMSKTLLGKRFEYAIKEGEDTRVQMYKEGFDMIEKNPLFGVGLNNYRVLSSFEMYSHSDYIEVAANTGILGFILYFSIYLVLWRRLNRIQAMTNEPRLLYIIGLLKASIITMLFAAFGVSTITEKLTWLFLASAIGYSWSVERALVTIEKK